MESKRRHLEMIQGVIDRMDSSASILKGWAASLIIGIFLFIDVGVTVVSVLLFFIPIIVFWSLDSYYLLQERLFRSLYDKVRLLPSSEIDFSMHTKEFRGGKNTLFHCMFLSPNAAFYALMIFVSLLLMLV